MSASTGINIGSVNSYAWMEDPSLVQKSRSAWGQTDYTLNRNLRFTLLSGQTANNGNITLPAGTTFSLNLQTDDSGNVHISNDKSDVWGTTTVPGGPTSVTGYDVRQQAKISPYNLAYQGEA
ncbi:hypothetical protein L486_01937 [Kwoniella mangroviensis CBS 10435]|uniref:Uncharacterized protein n=1 Tax=Kwoniella mangroviensis CBS 10435 TaxID=1331196 RepID=A0A1B9J3E0_9TREE|nr:hypothetical protein L486_01937 [Kwoniella mangroviensis CBS 10435]